MKRNARVNLLFISSQHLYRSQQHLLPVLGLEGNSFNFLPPSFPLLGFSSQNKSCNKIGCVWIISRSFSIGSANGRNKTVSNSQTGLFPPQPGQQHGHWHLLAFLNPAQPAAGHKEAAVTCSASQSHSGRSEETSRVLTGMSSS